MIIILIKRLCKKHENKWWVHKWVKEKQWELINNIMNLFKAREKKQWRQKWDKLQWEKVDKTFHFVNNLKVSNMH
jgi:tetrahydrodipicolinate N-succinyltransferase